MGANNSSATRVKDLVDHVCNNYVDFTQDDLNQAAKLLARYKKHTTIFNRGLSPVQKYFRDIFLAAEKISDEFILKIDFDNENGYCELILSGYDAPKIYDAFQAGCIPPRIRVLRYIPQAAYFSALQYFTDQLVQYADYFTYEAGQERGVLRVCLRPNMEEHAKDVYTIIVRILGEYELYLMVEDFQIYTNIDMFMETCKKSIVYSIDQIDKIVKLYLPLPKKCSICASSEYNVNLMTTNFIIGVICDNCRRR